MIWRPHLKGLILIFNLSTSMMSTKSEQTTCCPTDQGFILAWVEDGSIDSGVQQSDARGSDKRHDSSEQWACPQVVDVVNRLIQSWLRHQQHVSFTSEDTFASNKSTLRSRHWKNFSSRKKCQTSDLYRHVQETPQHGIPQTNVSMAVRPELSCA